MFFKNYQNLSDGTVFHEFTVDFTYILICTVCSGALYYTLNNLSPYTKDVVYVQ